MLQFVVELRANIGNYFDLFSKNADERTISCRQQIL
jgi:hypothetical protein